MFNHDSSSFECHCPGGFSGPTCANIDECFQNNACGDPEYEGKCVDGDCDFTCACIGGHSSSGGVDKSCDVRLPTVLRTPA